MNNKNNTKASEWTETLIDERHAPGKGEVSGADARNHGFVSLGLLLLRMKVGIRRLFIIACCAPVDGERNEIEDAF